jgi:hypothetical protein
VRAGLGARLRRLEAGAAHAAEAQGCGRYAAAAHAEISDIIDAVCAEKRAGDPQGVASRLIAAVPTDMERRPGGKTTPASGRAP